MAEKRLKIWYDKEGDFLEVMFEQRADAKDHRGLSACYEGRDDRPDKPARGALDDDVGDIGEFLDRQHGWPLRQFAKPVVVFLGVLRRHRCQNQAIYAAVQRLCYLGPDGAQPGNGDAQVRS